MTYLITGGTGINASQVVRELVKRGERPIIFDIVPELRAIKEAANQVKTIKGDVTDFGQLLYTIKNEQVDRIVHMAYLMESTDPTMAFKVNLVGTFNVLEAARILDLKKVVWTSSWQVYGDVVSEIPMSEDHPKSPKNIYSAGKLALEIWGESYAKAYGLDFTALRFSMLYGPGRAHSTYAHIGVDLMVVNSVYGKPSRIVAGDEKIQLLYLKDMANAILLADRCEKPKHKVFNIGNEEYFSIKEVADLIRKLIPSANIEIFPAKQESPPSNRRLDYKAAREELGYAPQYTLERGLKDYIECVRLDG